MCRTGPMSAYARRKSADVGGLALALGETGSGSGWGGWDESESDEVPFAELLSDMVASTQATVNFHYVPQPVSQISSETRQRLIFSLDSWNFEPHKLPEDEGLAAALILFETLLLIDGMEEDVGCTIEQIAPFLCHLRQIYRQCNSYHNFHHALDVLQATHIFLSHSGIVPPVQKLSTNKSWQRMRPGAGGFADCLTNTDIFALYIAAIGHDVGHPGFSNVFMKNAQTPLSTVYDHKSPLEQMHYTLLLRVMRYHGLNSILSRPATGPFFRELLAKTVLATDMSLHFKFMADFAAMADGAEVDLAQRRVFVCQSLMKCSDISNPSRPLGVSRYWANALMAEWTNQAALEKHLHLPSTVQPSDDPMSEAKSQVFFISTFAKPLFDLTARAIPGVVTFAEQCTSNGASWAATVKRLTTEAENGNAVPSTPSRSGSDSSTSSASSTRSGGVTSYMDAFPLTLPPTLRPGDEPGAESHCSHTPTRSSFAPSTFSASGMSSAPTSPPHTRTPSPTMPGAYIHSPPRPPPLPLRTISLPFESAQVHANGKGGGAGPLSPSPLSALQLPFPTRGGGGGGTGALRLDTLGPGHAPSTHATHVRTPSNASVFSVSSSASTSASATKNADQAAIRAALKASVRKKKSFHRSSWDPRAVTAAAKGAPEVPPVVMLFQRAGAAAAAAAAAAATTAAPAPTPA